MLDTFQRGTFTSSYDLYSILATEHLPSYKMVFTTNPYVNYHDGNSKEFIQLNKGAMIDIRFTEKFDLKPSNANAFAECTDKIFKSYAYYGMIRRFPTMVLLDTTGTYIIGNHANLLETWNQIGLDVVVNNANMT